MDKENCNPDLNGSSGSTHVVKYENLEQIRRLRRTLSFITTKKKKATQFCKLNKNNRRLSLNYPKKSFTVEIRVECNLMVEKFEIIYLFQYFLFKGANTEADNANDKYYK